jgi:2-polyprenyl-6-hydroxyphenyl methylase/3-demethylubiquinone-9 3-methyltransferase
MLEHVERPGDVLREAARVVRPGGAVVFHTFNRTPLAWLLAIHGFRFVVRDVPDHVHVYRLFIPPTDLTRMSADVGLGVREVVGVRPKLDRPFWRSLAQRRIAPGFRFVMDGPPWIGYIGHAVRGG